MIAPLVFASVVQGIAGTGDLKRVGRMGAKALHISARGGDGMEAEGGRRPRRLWGGERVMEQPKAR
jgi:hypothetical protein